MDAVETPIPQDLQQLFDKSCKNNLNKNNICGTELTKLNPLIQPLNGQPYTSSDPIQICQAAVLQFILPSADFIIFPTGAPLSAKEIEEKGEFWVNRTGLNTPQDLCINWERIANITDKQYIECRTVLLLNWIEQSLSDMTVSSSIKKEACSLLFEIVDIFFSVGTYLDLLHLNWDYSDISTISQIINIFPNQYLFTSKLVTAMKALVKYGSGKEAYVCCIGILQHKKIGLYGKLIILPLLGTVLEQFTTKRAAFLMSANTTIHSVFFKTGELFNKANSNFELLQCELDTTVESSSEKIVLGTPPPPPPYFKWLIGFSIYMLKYYDALGQASVSQQQDDYHGVGTNSCASLLAKAILVLGLTFEITSPSNCYTLNEFVWDPLHTVTQYKLSNTPHHVDFWVNHMSKIALVCLTDMIMLYIQIQGPNFLNQLETVNIVTPLDDGGGDLEITPLCISVISVFSCLSQTININLPICKYLPLVLSPWRYMNIAFSNAYVLMCCGSSIEGDASKSTGAFLLEDSTSCLFQIRRQKAADFGVKLFAWACYAPHCLISVEQDYFKTLFGFSTRPSQLLFTVLSCIALHRPREMMKEMRLFLKHTCFIKWLERFPLSLRLHILISVAENADCFLIIRDTVLEALIDLFKCQCVLRDNHLSTDTMCLLEDCHIYYASIHQLSQIVFKITSNLSENHKSIISLLNVFKFIFLSPNHSHLRNLLILYKHPSQEVPEGEMVQALPWIETLLNTLAEHVDIQRNMLRHASFNQLGNTLCHQSIEGLSTHDNCYHKNDQYTQLNLIVYTLGQVRELYASVTSCTK